MRAECDRGSSRGPVGVDPGFEENAVSVSVLGHQQDNEGLTCELLCKLLKEV